MLPSAADQSPTYGSSVSRNIVTPPAYFTMSGSPLPSASSQSPRSLQTTSIQSYSSPQVFLPPIGSPASPLSLPSAGSSPLPSAASQSPRSPSPQSPVSLPVFGQTPSSLPSAASQSPRSPQSPVTLPSVGQSPPSYYTGLPSAASQSPSPTRTPVLSMSSLPSASGQSPMSPYRTSTASYQSIPNHIINGNSPLPSAASQSPRSPTPRRSAPSPRTGMVSPVGLNLPKVSSAPSTYRLPSVSSKSPVSPPRSAGITLPQLPVMNTGSSTLPSASSQVRSALRSPRSSNPRSATSYLPQAISPTVSNNLPSAAQQSPRRQYQSSRLPSLPAVSNVSSPYSYQSPLSAPATYGVGAGSLPRVNMSPQTGQRYAGDVQQSVRPLPRPSSLPTVRLPTVNRSAPSGFALPQSNFVLPPTISRSV